MSNSTHPAHAYRYHHPTNVAAVMYTDTTQPLVALGVFASAARSLGWPVPVRITQITPWYQDDIRRVPMPGKVGSSP